MSRPIAPDLFTWPAHEPRLLGSRCIECSTVVFPSARSCPRCGSTEVESHELGRRGRLFTFTTEGFLPKEPYTGPETEDTFEISIPDDLPPDTILFHAGTARDSDGVLRTSGGRVLCATGLGPDVPAAVQNSHNLAEIVEFDSKVYRRDIAWREVARAGTS